MIPRRIVRHLWRIAAFAAILLPGSASADSITLTWTAPGDDGNSGRAAAYEIRFSEQPIAGQDTTSWWNAATGSGAIPPPQSAGARESYTVTGLTTGSLYYFVIRTADEVPNVSGFSNVSARQAGGSGSNLATPAGFTAEAVAGGVLLSWEEPQSGAGDGYRIYRRTGSAGADSLFHAAPVGQTSWTDSTAQGGATYEYRIATYQGTAEGTPAVATVSVPTQPIASGSAELRGYPNPARGKVTLRFRGGTKDGAPGRVRLVVFDLTGHRICELIDGERPAGEQTIEWACRSDAGNPVAPGIYNVIFDGPQGRSVTRIAVVP